MSKEEINEVTGLTAKEQECMDHLVDAWNVFVELEKQHPDEANNFAMNIHAIQGILVTRMARRLYPEGWPTYSKD